MSTDLECNSKLGRCLRDLAAGKPSGAAAQEQPLVQQADLLDAQDEQQQGAKQLQASVTVVESGSGQAGSFNMAKTSSKRSFIKIHPHPQVPNKLLYICFDAEGSVSMVKFSTEHCLRLHQLLSDADLAPKLMGFEHLPGGWVKMEMQFLSHHVWRDFQEVLDEGDDSRIQLACDAILPRLDLLHNMPGGPWVWGDARPPNIMLRW